MNHETEVFDDSELTTKYSHMVTLISQARYRDACVVASEHRSEIEFANAEALCLLRRDVAGAALEVFRDLLDRRSFSTLTDDNQQRIFANYVSALAINGDVVAARLAASMIEPAHRRQRVQSLLLGVIDSEVLESAGELLEPNRVAA